MNVEPFRVAFDEPIAAFANAANEIAGYTDVDRAAGPAREDIEIIVSHEGSLPKGDGRNNPGHEVFGMPLPHKRGRQCAPSRFPPPPPPHIQRPCPAVACAGALEADHQW